MKNASLDWLHLSQQFQSHAHAQGFSSTELITHQGFTSRAYAKASPQKPLIYLSAGMHGDEPAGPLALLELLKENAYYDHFSWMICPHLNPSGLLNGTRENSQIFDLNRDYLLKSMPETQAHIAWLESHPTPDLFLSLHEDWESTGFYFYEISPAGTCCAHRKIIQAASPHFPPEPEETIDGHPVTEPGWIYHADKPDLPEGWPEAIYLAHQGCPTSLTFETPSSAQLSQRINCHKAIVKEAFKLLK